MAKPQVEIDVDDATGRWSVDGLPMILIPQHFFVNNHVAVESALGAEEFGRVLAPAGYRSAYFWCEREAAYHKLNGVDVFLHYMRRLSQRGWAQFKVLSCDEATGRASVRVDHSLLVTGTLPGQNRKLCYMFGPWLQGSLEFVMTASGRPAKVAARELYCAAEGTYDHCLFEVTPEPELT